MGSISPSLKRTTSAKQTESRNAAPCRHRLSPIGGEDVRRSSSSWSGSAQPREPLGMPGPGHWFEPHPRARLEHPRSLRPSTLRAQKPASLHLLRIVSCLLCFTDILKTCTCLRLSVSSNQQISFVITSFKQKSPSPAVGQLRQKHLAT